MAFVTLSSDYVKSGYTLVDNIFFSSYLPYADGLDVKIYLLGLSLATSGDGDISPERMALVLHTDEKRVQDSYRYWEEKGLVLLTKTDPFTVKYTSVKQPTRPVVKVNAEKYAVFVEEVARLYPDKILSPNEFNEYFELMHAYKMETNAMLLVMQYCKELGGGKFSASYILAVANDWVKQGLTSEEKVSAHIAELENNSEDIRQIFTALGLKRTADLEDRQFYLKWKNKFGYRMDGILIAARSLKRRGGTERLDTLMEELYAVNALTAEEIAAFLGEKEHNRKLAVDISKNLGTYYGSTDVLCETYIQPWRAMGYDRNALIQISKFCLVRNIRNFEGMAALVERLFKGGAVSEDGVRAFIDGQFALDGRIKAVFDACGHYGAVTGRDRDFYRYWLEWGFDENLILFVAGKNAGKPFPMQGVNRALSLLHDRKVFDIPTAEKVLNEQTTGGEERKPTKIADRDNYLKHEYSDEQLKSVLTDFSDWE